LGELLEDLRHRRASLICRSDTPAALATASALPLRRPPLSGPHINAGRDPNPLLDGFDRYVGFGATKQTHQSEPAPDDDSENDAARTIAVPASSRGGLTIWKPAIDLG
jgi:hypothetical protein